MTKRTRDLCYVVAIVAVLLGILWVATASAQVDISGESVRVDTTDDGIENTDLQTAIDNGELGGGGAIYLPNAGDECTTGNQNDICVLGWSAHPTNGSGRSYVCTADPCTTFADWKAFGSDAARYWQIDCQVVATPVAKFGDWCIETDADGGLYYCATAGGCLGGDWLEVANKAAGGGGGGAGHSEITTPGAVCTTGAYLDACFEVLSVGDTAGNIKLCTNPVGCTVAGDWTAVGGQVGRFTLSTCDSAALVGVAQPGDWCIQTGARGLWQCSGGTCTTGEWIEYANVSGLSTIGDLAIVCGQDQLLENQDGSTAWACVDHDTGQVVALEQFANFGDCGDGEVLVTKSGGVGMECVLPGAASLGSLLYVRTIGSPQVANVLTAGQFDLLDFDAAESWDPDNAWTGSAAGDVCYTGQSEFLADVATSFTLNRTGGGATEIFLQLAFGLTTDGTPPANGEQAEPILEQTLGRDGTHMFAMNTLTLFENNTCIGVMASPESSGTYNSFGMSLSVVPIQGLPSTGPNDYTADPNAIAWYNFSDHATATNCTDFIGSNDLTPAGGNPTYAGTGGPSNAPAGTGVMTCDQASMCRAGGGNTNFNNTTFTMCAMVTSTESIAGGRAIYARGTEGWDVRYYNSGLHHHDFLSGAETSASVNSVVDFTTWNRVCYRYSPSTLGDYTAQELQVYTNGAQDCSGGCNTVLMNTPNYTQGLDICGGSGTNWGGSFADVIYFDRLLQEDEICELSRFGADGTWSDAGYACTLP